MIRLPDKTFFKFVAVGIINTLVGASVMFASFNLLHWNYWVSTALNYIVGSIVSYYLNKRFTFEQKNNDKKSFLRFVINISVCYLLAYGIAKPLAVMVFSFATPKLQENLAMLFGMGLFVLANYFGQRFFVFRDKKKESD